MKWNRLSRAAGLPWGVAFDEPGNASGVCHPMSIPGAQKLQRSLGRRNRKWVLWGNLLGGGWGGFTTTSSRRTILFEDQRYAMTLIMLACPDFS